MIHPLSPALIAFPPRVSPRDHPRPLRQRLPEAKDLQAEVGPLGRSAKLAVVEAALMLGEEPIPARKLAQVAGLESTAEARRLVAHLQEQLEQEGSAFQVDELAGGYQLLTRPEYYPWLARHRRAGGDLRLTSAGRETLAIVAYRQPIMRADIEAIRGVQSGDVLRLLMEKGLVRIAGRDDSLGRPVLYGTTRKFLQLMGLKSLADLPRAGELRRPAHVRRADDHDQTPGDAPPAEDSADG